MIKKLAVGLAITMLLVVAPQAKSDSIAVAVNEIYLIDPVLVNGEPDPTAMVEYSASEIAFVTRTYHIGITWQALQAISVSAFGNPNAQVLIWDDSMSVIGCPWEAFCDGEVKFDDSGVIGNGTLHYTPHFGILTIDSLTITTPEPDSLFLLSSALLGFAMLFRRGLFYRPYLRRS